MSDPSILAYIMICDGHICGADECEAELWITAADAEGLDVTACGWADLRTQLKGDFECRRALITYKEHEK